MKIFSPGIKRQMKDCILAILWPKKDVYAFFKDCSVPAVVLNSIKPWDDLTRAAMIDRVFAALGTQPDNGTMQFDIMLEVLACWSYFDEHWFVTEQKLDLETAKKKIAALTTAKHGHIDVTRKAVAERRAKEAAREERHQSLEAMKQDFQAVATTPGTPQQRGSAFEAFLGKMARYFDLPVTSPFRIRGTQIDGSIKYDGENYNIEAKWEHRALSDEPLFAFCHKLGITMHGRGIFISGNSYTPEALSMLERGGVKNTVLMDGEDITLILHELVTLPEALDKKIRAAQTRGQFYIHPVTGESKITPIS